MKKEGNGSVLTGSDGPTKHLNSERPDWVRTFILVQVMFL
jgi:hypothetical protein